MDEKLGSDDLVAGNLYFDKNQIFIRSIKSETQLALILIISTNITLKNWKVKFVIKSGFLLALGTDIGWTEYTW